MDSLQPFHALVGEILMYCQMIEHDVKEIYASRAGGDYSKNLASLKEEKTTMGQTVTKLKELDRALSKPLFSQKDYDLLFQIVSKRNYYAHEAYLSFVYVIGEVEVDFAYQQAYQTASYDKQKLSALYEAVEDVRLSVVDF